MRDSRCKMLDALVVESHSINESICLANPEQARFCIAGLRARRHGPEFYVTESHRTEGIQAISILVEPGRESERMCKLKPETAHR